MQGKIAAADIKAYDSVTGAEVTNKFDIKVENGTITATSKEAFIKDKVNAPVIDTTKFEFGRYYKFDIPATVKESVKAGADIENTANQTAPNSFRTLLIECISSRIHLDRMQHFFNARYSISYHFIFKRLNFRCKVTHYK